MLGRIRWQLATACVGLLVVLTLLGSLAIRTAATASPSGYRTYVEGVVGVPRQFNPLLQRPDSPRAEHDLAALVFEGLTRPGPNGAPEPALAERWSTDDGRIWTFWLRPELRWHDGVAFTSDDVVFTVRSVQDAAFPGDPVLASFWRAVDVEAVDDFRVRFTLAQPYAPFLAATSLPLMPRHLLGNVPLADWADDSFSRNPIGTGAFRLESYDASEARLRPFEGAIRGRPPLDLLVLRFYASSEEARAALLRRDIEGLAGSATPGTALPTTARETRRIVPLAEYVTLQWNTRQAPLDNRRLREALVRGLDRVTLVERALDGNGLPLDTPLLPQTSYRSTARLPSSDGAMAARILDEMGWTRAGTTTRANNGTPLALPLLIVDTPPQQVLAREIVRQWSAVGIDVPVEAVHAAVFRDRIARRSFTLALRFWTPGADPDMFALWHSSQAATGANEGGLSDQQIDRLIEGGRTTLEADQRVEIYRALADRWAALLPGLPLYQSVLVYDLARDIQPTELEPSQLLSTPGARFDGISTWTFPNR